jgi:hypothetical protein
VAVGAGVHEHRRHPLNTVVAERLRHMIDQGADVVDVGLVRFAVGGWQGG